MNGLDRVKVAMESESKGRKAYLAVQALIFLAFFSTVAVLFGIRFMNANDLNSAVCKSGTYSKTSIPVWCLITDNNLYNVGFLLDQSWSDES